MSDLLLVAARQGPEDGVLCNDRATQVLEAYTDAAKEKHGTCFDVMNEPLDLGVVYKAGSGKKHGRHMMGDGFIDSRASISQGRSMSTATVDDIRPPRRVRTSTDRIQELESKVDQMHQILLSLQGHLTGTPAIANNAVTPLSTPLGTPGTAGSVGNTRATNGDSPPVDHVDECNADILM